jgi:hypothetical protein
LIRSVHKNVLMSRTPDTKFQEAKVTLFPDI